MNKKYSVRIENDRFGADSNCKEDSNSVVRRMANRCENIEKILNSPYEFSEVDYNDKVHSVVEISDGEDKQLLTIYEQEINNVEFIIDGEEDNSIYELNNQQLTYIKDFRKVILNKEIYNVVDIVYDLDDDIIKVTLSK